MISLEDCFLTNLIELEDVRLNKLYSFETLDDKAVSKENRGSWTKREIKFNKFSSLPEKESRPKGDSYLLNCKRYESFESIKKRLETCNLCSLETKGKFELKKVEDFPSLKMVVLSEFSLSKDEEVYLEKILSSINIGRERGDFFYMPVVNCDFSPSVQSDDIMRLISNCFEFTRSLLEHYQPAVLLVFGKSLCSYIEDLQLKLQEKGRSFLFNFPMLKVPCGILELKEKTNEKLKSSLWENLKETRKFLARKQL